MAEFCVDCWNEFCGTDLPACKFVLTREDELCEGCGEFKRTVIKEKNSCFVEIIKFFFSK